MCHAELFHIMVNISEYFEYCPTKMPVSFVKLNTGSYMNGDESRETCYVWLCDVRLARCSSLDACYLCVPAACSTSHPHVPGDLRT